MKVPVESRSLFLHCLGPDFPSHEAIIKAISCFYPEVLIRTACLYYDFHKQADNRKLEFLNLPNRWQDFFTLDRPPENFSVCIGADPIESYLLTGWKSAIESKSSLAPWMHDKAAAQFN